MTLSHPTVPDRGSKPTGKSDCWWYHHCCNGNAADGVCCLCAWIWNVSWMTSEDWTIFYQSVMIVTCNVAKIRKVIIRKWLNAGWDHSQHFLAQLNLFQTFIITEFQVEEDIFFLLITFSDQLQQILSLPQNITLNVFWVQNNNKLTSRSYPSPPSAPVYV